MAMAEYIDKGALYEKIAQLEEIARNRYLDNPSNSPAYQRYIAQMQERTALKHLIADFPAVDAVPVVRCKDCKWFADNNGGEWYGCKMFHVVRITPDDAPKPDDFCSYGERREE